MESLLVLLIFVVFVVAVGALVATLIEVVRPGKALIATGRRYIGPDGLESRVRVTIAGREAFIKSAHEETSAVRSMGLVVDSIELWKVSDAFGYVDALRSLFPKKHQSLPL
jgi:hypothetical protein